MKRKAGDFLSIIYIQKSKHQTGEDIKNGNGKNYTSFTSNSSVPHPAKRTVRKDRTLQPWTNIKHITTKKKLK
jgi:hypothetical protein